MRLVNLVKATFQSNHHLVGELFVRAALAYSISECSQAVELAKGVGIAHLYSLEAASGHWYSAAMLSKISNRMAPSPVLELVMITAPCPLSG